MLAPALGVPVGGIPLAVSSSNSPKGTRQATSPVFPLIATSSIHGGGTQRAADGGVAALVMSRPKPRCNVTPCQPYAPPFLQIAWSTFVSLRLSQKAWSSGVIVGGLTGGIPCGAE
jgi:hypothetical protein